MQVSVETVKGLQRKMTVTIPAAEVNEAVTKKLKSLKNEIRVDGFRPGKVPTSVIQKRYGGAIRADVLGEVIERTYGETLTQENLKPAGNPNIDMDKQEARDKDFIYTAEFEVYPDFELADVSEFKLERPVVEIADSDIDAMLEKLRTQHIVWNEVDRKSKKEDQVTISFKGTIDGEAFEGGKADNVPVVLGSNSMIAGFEDGLLNLSAGDETTLDLKFPDNYKEELAGKQVKFEVKINQVAESTLPEVDDEFAKKFGVKEGGVEALRKQIKTNMQRECEQYQRQFVKNQVTEALHTNNSNVEIPDSLIEQEVKGMIENLKRQMQGGNVDDLVNVENMKPEAERRVRLGLVMSEVMLKNDIKLDNKILQEFIKAEAASYEDPQQFIDYYNSNEDAINSIKPLVLEQQVVEHIMEKAQVKDVELGFDELVEKVNPKAESK